MSKGNPYGVGYNTIGNYTPTYINENGNKRNTPHYSTWINMLGRCYNPKYQEKKPTYKGCFVCEEWLNFQEFGKWYDDNYYTISGEQIALDKDILYHSNKVYSPDTCLFVPSKINSVLTSCKSVRGSLPVGVTFKEGRYYVRVSDYLSSGKRIDLGYYYSIHEAFSVYKNEKENVIKRVADTYKDKIPQKLYNALYAYTVEIDD